MRLNIHSHLSNVQHLGANGRTALLQPDHNMSATLPGLDAQRLQGGLVR